MISFLDAKVLQMVLPGQGFSHGVVGTGDEGSRERARCVRLRGHRENSQSNSPQQREHQHTQEHGLGRGGRRGGRRRGGRTITAALVTK